MRELLDRQTWDKKYGQIGDSDIAKYVEKVSQAQGTGIVRAILDIPNISSSLRILEAGSGTGRITACLTRLLGVQGFGLDYSQEANYVALSMARALGQSCIFVSADIGQMPFPDNSFDLVFSDSVIEHLVDPQQALFEMARVVRHGGIVVVTTPNRLRPDGWDLYRWLRRPEYLQRSFTPWHLSAMLRSAGLNIEAFFGDTLLLPRNLFILRDLLLRKRQGLHRRRTRGPSRNRRGRGYMLKLERWARRFVPSYFWVNIGIIAKKPKMSYNISALAYS